MKIFQHKKQWGLIWLEKGNLKKFKKKRLRPQYTGHRTNDISIPSVNQKKYLNTPHRHIDAREITW